MNKSVLVAYRSLPYILYRKKYLIPQAPYLQVKYLSEHLNSSASYFNRIKKDYPYLINEEIIKQSQDNKNEQLKSLYVSQYNKKRQEYKQQIQQYIREYIKPLQIIGKHTHPHFFYFYDNKDKIEKIMAETGQQRFKVMYRMYKELDDSTKRIYQEKCQQKIKELMKAQAQVEAKCKIPDKLWTHPHILYLRQKSTQPITIHAYKIYKTLPEPQKQYYREKARQLKALDKKNLQYFLATRNLTSEKFTYIKKICEQVAQIKKSLKQQKSTKMSINKILLGKKKQQSLLSIQADKEAKIKKPTGQLSIQQQNQLSEWKKEMEVEKEVGIDQDIYISEDQTLLEQMNLTEVFNKLKKNNKQ